MNTTLISQYSSGTPFPLGATREKSGFNFALFSEVQVLELVIATPTSPEACLYVPLDPERNKTGQVWHLFYETDESMLYYAYTIKDGDTKRLVQDPYARLVHTGNSFGDNAYQSKTYETKPIGIAFTNRTFDWEDDKPLQLDSKNLIIYEMHVRGFTKDSSSKVSCPGTYSGVIEKIPYLKKLGINAIEFLPLHEFNEADNFRKNPKTKEPLCNFWGYSTLSFFSPMQRYSSYNDPIEALYECKKMVRELHKAGIEVIVDVVFNHTGEGNEQGPKISWKALAETTYYLKNSEGYYLNFSGCGNTLNCNHPIVADMIIDSLRYWVSELHVDGFRFDLASILMRDQDGQVLETAPLIERITQDPVLSHCKLIAEPWDAAGAHQVGHFYQSHWGKPETWLEWNDSFRSVVRNFIKGTPGFAGYFATKLCGSQDVYGHSGSPANSVNFITCHDGFTLCDLVSYNHKHNSDNGEDNRDGMNNNDSWNGGVEGPTKQKSIQTLRTRQMKNFCVALLCSIGVPMFLMGDEYGHSKKGNNNTWCQDNALNWFLWDEANENSELFSFWSKMISFRKNTHYFRRAAFFAKDELEWHGKEPNHPDWGLGSKIVAFTVDDLYVAFNADHTSKFLTLPGTGKARCIVNTAEKAPCDFIENPDSQKIVNGKIKVSPYSAVVLRFIL